MKCIKWLCLFAMLALLSSCGVIENEAGYSSGQENSALAHATEATTAENIPSMDMEDERVETEMKIKITVGNKELIAVLEDNATTQALIKRMPMTLSMMDLYGREMCYRYGAYALPTDNLRSDRYKVGDIAYWAPGGSLVILYKQNGEQFQRQHLGHIDSGVEIFESTGDVDVTFELVAD